MGLKAADNAVMTDSFKIYLPRRVCTAEIIIGLFNGRPVLHTGGGTRFLPKAEEGK